MLIVCKRSVKHINSNVYMITIDKIYETELHIDTEEEYYTITSDSEHKIRISLDSNLKIDSLFNAFFILMHL